MGNDIQIGKYRANSKPLQETTFSTLYKAKTSIMSDREYLIKMITTKDPRHLSILKYEKRIHKMLQHENIVKLLEYDTFDGFPYLVFDYYPEGDLTQYFSDRLPSDTTLDVVFEQILDAVIYCHDNDVVHRDVKLENVIVVRTSPLRVALTDFGFARMVRDGELLSDNLGSADYAAPEVRKNIPYDGKKVDVWSLCVMYYHMVNSSFPFDGETIEEVERAVASCKFSPSKRHQKLFESVFIEDFTRRPSAMELKTKWKSE